MARHRIVAGALAFALGIATSVVCGGFERVAVAQGVCVNGCVKFICSLSAAGACVHHDPHEAIDHWNDGETRLGYIWDRSFYMSAFGTGCTAECTGQTALVKCNNGCTPTGPANQHNRHICLYATSSDP